MAQALPILILGEHALRCDVCGRAHQDVQALSAHLYTEHRLEPEDWDPLRDLLQGTEPVCSHCMAMFADKPAVRQHITLGQCPNFHPMRPVATLPISMDWQEFLQRVDIHFNAPEICLCTSTQYTVQIGMQHKTLCNCSWPRAKLMDAFATPKLMPVDYNTSVCRTGNLE